MYHLHIPDSRLSSKSHRFHTLTVDDQRHLQLNVVSMLNDEVDWLRNFVTSQNENVNETDNLLLAGHLTLIHTLSTCDGVDKALVGMSLLFLRLIQLFLIYMFLALFIDMHFLYIFFIYFVFVLALFIDMFFYIYYIFYVSLIYRYVLSGCPFSGK